MFICSDNLTYIKTLDSNSIDLIYFDPPFNITEADYDNKLDWDNLWGEMWRVLKPRANIVIHSSQPFTYDLIASQRKKFKYCWYWNKTYKTGHLFSKHQPMRQIEEICVFYKKGIYNPQTKIDFVDSGMYPTTETILDRLIPVIDTTANRSVDGGLFVYKEKYHPVLIERENPRFNLKSTLIRSTPQFEQYECCGKLDGEIFARREYINVG